MKYALVSVFDKSGLDLLVEKLDNKGFKVIASGNTYKNIKDLGYDALEVSEVTEFPEILGGRVKTLNPKIHGAILYKRDDLEHQNTIKEHNLLSIDLVICNLYPFEEVLKTNQSHEVLIENIDIGGPSMIRAAAKNYQDVAVCVDPSDYDALVENYEDLEFRKELAAKAFRHTAQYDAIISNYFNQETNNQYPEDLTLTYRKVEDLRYGENPHQSASYYEAIDTFENLEFKQIHGKQLSYNNINDMTGALKTLAYYTEPTAVAIKHANACGIASGETISEAFKKAYASDPVSIFGGIISLNREVDLATANQLKEIFLELIVAPSFTDEALEILMKKKNLRLIEMKDINEKRNLVTKDVLNGILIQETDTLDYKELDVVSNRIPSEEEMEELLFAWNSVKSIDSNAITIVKDKVTLALGHGEVRRVWSLEKAIERSLTDVKGAVIASDGFFFEDTVELCHQHGIKAIIQPGGSVKDPDVIEKCNEYDIALVFTHARHFKH